MRVEQLMARPVQSCRSEDTLARVRRPPVLDGEDALVGMISLADLAQEAARQRATATQEISESDVGDTLAAISHPLHRELAA
jgi:CBS-domain-containing membrane protein